MVAHNFLRLQLKGTSIQVVSRFAYRGQKRLSDPPGLDGEVSEPTCG